MAIQSEFCLAAGPDVAVPLLIQEALPRNPADDLAYAEALDQALAYNRDHPDNPMPFPNRPDFRLLAGVDRVSEPVTFGLPLPANAAITNVDQLHLGAATLQCRVLQRWGVEANSPIQWVLLDTQVSVATGTNNTNLVLTTGAGNQNNPALASEVSGPDGDFIIVETGAAEFRIRKQRFNLLDRVRVGPPDTNRLELVSAGASPGIVLTGADDTIRSVPVSAGRQGAESRLVQRKRCGMGKDRFTSG